MGQFTVTANRLGFKGFSEKCDTIYKNFKLYGESVLEVEFVDSDEIEKNLRELFLTVSQNNFSKEIKKFWDDHYTFIIKKPSDFNSVPNSQKDILVLEAYPYCYEKYKISKELYDKLYENRFYYPIGNTYFSYVLDNDFLYVIEFNAKEKCKIILSSKIPLSSVLTE